MKIFKGRDAKLLESQLNHIRMDIARFSELAFNDEILKKVAIVKEERVDKKLKDIHIDSLSALTKNIPVRALTNIGIENIYKLQDLSIENLTNVNGISRQGALNINETVVEIKESIFNDTNIRIDPDDIKGSEMELLYSIYRKRELIPVAEDAKKIYKILTEYVEPRLELAKKKKGTFLAFFQSLSLKQKIDDAIYDINRETVQQDIAYINRKIKQLLNFQVDKDAVIKDFIKNNANYYSEIEKITRTQIVDYENDLPSDIVNAVNRFPLNIEGLSLSLRKYQEFGAKYAALNGRTLLGDEMGLGKTIQALALIMHVYNAQGKYSIVVCPLSVLTNWKREIEANTTMKAYVFHGPKRAKEYEGWSNDGGILITTYGQISHLNMDEMNIDVLVVDEAHYIKNPDALRSKRTYELSEKAKYILFMSGTPLENKLDEMKQLISVLNPEIAEIISKELHLLHPVEFKNTIAPVYLRRNRDKVLSELPELEEIPKWVEFGADEKEYYRESVLIQDLNGMRRAAWMGNRPAESPKLQMVLDICQEAEENGHKVIVFSFYKMVFNKVYQHLKDKTFEPITGDVSNKRRQEIIDEFTEAEAGGVLISQIEAGGVGLNIQAASVVILCEPQWKPSTEQQAISRAYRMGQARNVVVYRLLTEESIDGRIMELLGNKSKIFDLYAKDSNVAHAFDQMTEGRVRNLQKKALELEKIRMQKSV